MQRDSTRQGPDELDMVVGWLWLLAVALFLFDFWWYTVSGVISLIQLVA